MICKCLRKINDEAGINWILYYEYAAVGEEVEDVREKSIATIIYVAGTIFLELLRAKIDGVVDREISRI